MWMFFARVVYGWLICCSERQRPTALLAIIMLDIDYLQYVCRKSFYPNDHFAQFCYLDVVIVAKSLTHSRCGNTRLPNRVLAVQH